jgi:hypothetical protein
MTTEEFENLKPGALIRTTDRARWPGIKSHPHVYIGVVTHADPHRIYLIGYTDNVGIRRGESVPRFKQTRVGFFILRREAREAIRLA